MKITKIKIKYLDGARLRAKFSITFDNCFTINDCCVIIDEEKNMKFVAFPFTKNKDDEIIDLAYPITASFKAEITEKVFELYYANQEEYINEEDVGLCKVTACSAQNIEPGLFEVKLVLDDVFAINKLMCKVENNSLSFRHPFSKIVNEERMYLIDFENQTLIQDITMWMAKSCINKNVTSEVKVKTPEERREISNKKIKDMGIACHEKLPMIEASKDVKLKSLDEICKRAIATLISTQIACDINNNNYEESLKFFSQKLEQYEGVKEKLNSKEKKLFDGTYTRQDAIDIDWEYETYWAIVWALGLIDDDISNAGSICDCPKAISLVSKSRNLEDFKSKCHMRNIEEILDMLDLYYRYHWATTEKRINPDTLIGNLNPSVVVERRRGLEWLISDEEDWYDISLDT